MINAMGRIFMPELDDPFRAIDAELTACTLKQGADAIVIDFHAEATSEKQALGYFEGDVMQDIRRRLRKFPDLRGNVRNIQSLNLGGGRGDLDLAIRGPELTALAEYGERLRLKAPEIGIVDADSTLRLNKPELQVQIDRNRAADLGVNTEDIASALRVMVGGDDEVTRYRDSSVNDDYDVQLRLAEEDRNDPAKLGGLLVPRNTGELVRLDNLVSIVHAESRRASIARIGNARSTSAPTSARDSRRRTACRPCSRPPRS